MHDILNQNLQYFERRSQTLADRLKIISPDPSLELITAESGDLTAKKYSRNGSYHFIHSKKDPRREARMWTENQSIIMPCLVIIGVGFAYHVFELLKKCRNIENAYLIEADERMFQLAMKIHDFSSLIQNTAIHFLIGSQFSVIETSLSTSLVQPFSRHIFSPIVSLYPDIYNPVRELVEKHLCASRLKEENSVENLLNQMSTT